MMSLPQPARLLRPADAAIEGQRGQALVLFAGVLSVLLIVAGLVVDGGAAFYHRREGQNAADLATLAGTQIIADHYTRGGRSGADVYSAMVDSLADNGCTTSTAVPCSWTGTYIRPAAGGGEVQLGSVSEAGGIPLGAQGVLVKVHRTPDTYFLNLIARPQWEVDNEAAGFTARAGGLPPGQVLPIAVDPPNAHFQPNGVYELTAGSDGPGNFSWLSWDGSNDAGTLANSLCDPNNPALGFPVWLAGDPGKSNKGNTDGVRGCVDKWIDNGATVLIPLWDQVRGEGNNFEFRIRGLAAFVLLDHGQPAIDSITARFLEFYPLPTIGPNATWGSPPCAPGVAGCTDESIFIGIAR